jgi:ribosome-binding ATPase YchF (GTP1/OBG family)
MILVNMLGRTTAVAKRSSHLIVWAFACSRSVTDVDDDAAAGLVINAVGVMRCSLRQSRSRRFHDLVAPGSMQAGKAKGKVRLEGKDYVMADGDVVEFRSNV